MQLMNNYKKSVFLVYGLGLTGKSAVSFFKRNHFKNYQVWDDTKNYYILKKGSNLNKTLKEIDYIILSPGVSLNKSKNKDKLIQFKKIITDIDLYYLFEKNFLKVLL